MRKNIYDILSDLDDESTEISPSKNKKSKKISDKTSNKSTDKHTSSDNDSDNIKDDLCNSDTENKRRSQEDKQRSQEDQQLEYIYTDFDDNLPIDLEIIETDKDGTVYTEKYTVPYKPIFENEKRLLCYSIIHGTQCPYHDKCTYAHSIEEQRIDNDRFVLYQIILDAEIMNFNSESNQKKEEIYKNLLFSTHVCDKCTSSHCTGGYNCRNGIFDPTMKICRNDLMTGECLNKINKININPQILDNIKNITIPSYYEGCMNGHHLSCRGLLPYYKYVHHKDQSTKNQYQSVRYIDLQSAHRYFKSDENDAHTVTESSDSSTDEEINELFRKYKDSDLFDESN